MPLKVDCSECGKSYRVPDAHAGKTGRCKSCGAVMPIPLSSSGSAVGVAPGASLDPPPTENPDLFPPDHAPAERTSAKRLPVAKALPQTRPHKPDAARTDTPAPAVSGASNTDLIKFIAIVSAVAVTLIVAIVVFGIWLITRGGGNAPAIAENQHPAAVAPAERAPSAIPAQAPPAAAPTKSNSPTIPAPATPASTPHASTPHAHPAATSPEGTPAVEPPRASATPAGPTAPVATGPTTLVVEDKPAGNPATSENHKTTSVSPANIAPDGSSDEIVPAEATAAAGTQLQYRWKKGETYSYDFEIVAQLGDSQEKVTGRCEYKYDDETTQSVMRESRQADKEATGTGFVVHPDGYVVTCQHVVENVKRMLVTIGTKRYYGEVVAEDPDRDLALLKVRAENLPTLPLADSDDVALAQDVRAFGYPLSDVLGDNIKITRGTIAGINRTGRETTFQIDAAINPGNSGGPLVNDRGEVIGVNSAKMMGAAISVVGFAVPSNEVRKMLTAQRVSPPAPARAPAALPGPELARQVTPAIALIRVTSGMGEYVALKYSGHFANLSGSSVHRGSPSSDLKTDSGKIVLSPYGEVVEVTGDASLPYLYGPLAMVAIPPLSPRGENRWSEQQQHVLARTEASSSARPDYRIPMPPSPRSRYLPPSLRSRYLPPRSPYLPTHPSDRYRSPTPPPTQLVLERILETSNFRQLRRNGNLVQIQQNYELSSVNEPGEATNIEGRGTGEITFDTAAGVVEKLELNKTLTRTSGPVSIRLPVKLKISRRSAEQVAEDARKAAERSAKYEADRKKREAEAALSPAKKVDLYLSQIKDPDDGIRIWDSLSKLNRLAPVDTLRQKVLDTVLPLMSSSDHSVSREAIECVGKWGTKANIEALKQLVASKDYLSRSSAIDAIAALGRDDPQVAQYFATLFVNADTGERFQVEGAFRKMKKEVAEAAVIPLLSHADADIRDSATGLLRQVGTSKSAQALKDLLKTEQSKRVIRSAESAISWLER